MLATAVRAPLATRGRSSGDPLAATYCNFVTIVGLVVWTLTIAGHSAVAQSTEGGAAFMLTKGHMHPVQKGFISFTNVVTNVSSRLVPEFGVFMSLQPGVYEFTMVAATQQRVPFRIAIKLNRDTVATMYGSPNDYQQVSQTVVLLLRSGDFIYPFVEVGDIFESAIQDRAYTVFSGFQVGMGGESSATGNTTLGGRGTTVAAGTAQTPAVTTRGVTTGGPLTTTSRAVTNTTSRAVTSTTSRAMASTTSRAATGTTSRAVTSTTSRAATGTTSRAVTSTTSRAATGTTSRAVTSTTSRAATGTTSRAVTSTTSRAGTTRRGREALESVEDMEPVEDHQDEVRLREFIEEVAKVNALGFAKRSTNP